MVEAVEGVLAERDRLEGEAAWLEGLLGHNDDAVDGLSSRDGARRSTLSPVEEEEEREAADVSEDVGENEEGWYTE